MGRIFKANTSPVGTPWMWTVSYGFHEDHTPTHGYKPTREAAMAAFAKSWRRVDARAAPACGGIEPGRTAPPDRDRYAAR